MQFFIDSADVEAIRAMNELSGLPEGVTTNPSLMLKAGGNVMEKLKEICAIVGGPVSVEVTAHDFETMMAQANALVKIADNICIKLPMTYDGLRACKELSLSGHKTNMTLCFSLTQAVLAAKANATFVSPFIGRLDDIGENGLGLIADIRRAYDLYDFKTKILAASIRRIEQIEGAIRSGADIVTAPPQLMRDMIKHPLTDKGIAAFEADWAKTGQTIE